MHFNDIWKKVSFFQVTLAAGGDDILPSGFSSARFGDQMIKR